MQTPHRPRRDRRLATILAAVIALTGIVSAAQPATVSAAASITALAAHGPGTLVVPGPASLVVGSQYLTNATTTWTVTRSADGNEVVVEIDDAIDDQNDWYIGLAAPAGSVLAVGAYTNARYPAEPGHGTLTLRHHDPTCSPIVGQFTILALTVDGTGHVTSLAASLEHGCFALDAPRDYLDIRYASDVAIRALETTPRSLTFEPSLIGHATANVATTVQARGTASTTVSSVTIVGPNAGDFQVTGNTCLGALAPAGAPCTINVKATASSKGLRQADLVIHDDGFPGTQIVALTATGLTFTVAPTSLAFGSHLVDTTTSMTVTLSNGGQPLNLGDLQFDVIEGGSPFSARPNLGCTAISSLAADAACDLTIDFTPRDAQSWSTGAQWFLGAERVVVLFTGTGAPTSGVGWGSAKTIRTRAWSSGNALARSTRTSPTAAYLHAVVTTDYIGGKYARNTSPKLGVYYRRSSNGGSSWTTAVRINPTTNHADRAAVAASGSRVYVAYVTQTKWVNYSRTAPRVLYLKRNTSYGSSASWKTAKRLTSLTGRVDYPSIAASGSHVYVAYTNSSTGSIKLAVSHDKGVTWVTKTLGSTTRSTTDGKSGLPSVSTSGSLVVVSWTADSNGKVVSRVSTNAGSGWSSTATLAAAAAGFVTTGAASGRVSTAWPTDDGVSVRTWRPSAWGPVVAVTPPGAPGKFEWFHSAAMVLNGTGRTGIAWSACHADCDSDSPYLDLLWAESTDGGATFPHRQVIVNSTASGSYSANWFPSVTWGAATTRYILYSADRIGSSFYNVHIRAGNGAP